MQIGLYPFDRILGGNHMKQNLRPRRRSLFLSAYNAANNVLRAGLLAGAAWIVYSNYYIKHKVDLGPAVPAERKDFESKNTGRVS